MSVNVVVREGNLTKAVSYFPAEGEKKSFASIRVASYGGKKGDEKLTIYASVRCYGFLADQIKDLAKGDTVVFSGRVQADSYEQDGKTVETEVIVASDITYRKKDSSAPKNVTKGEDEIPF